ncbi:uncharacterized protein LOC115627537 isoform X3 [Scaptodrosophila lebanonensis]|uniref:Uncharacterized protein LOC115627537 isoform X3 n=1 Tax=Drosophila lebanonensis TaxID=7225 RepID=A0A6J2TU55_DROLE|nr:uncharacterized protein LOC115627537 isoform X3 [Scaptodrosophila lebanonensis]XP_030379106.1 uncharacterized protein LOC115627537 isoform X3 [Scaptodrosophila lebanonensis]
MCDKPFNPFYIGPYPDRACALPEVPPQRCSPACHLKKDAQVPKCKSDQTEDLRHRAPPTPGNPNDSGQGTSQDKASGQDRGCGQDSDRSTHRECK